MEIVSVTALVFPYDRVHDLYQEYYRGALRSFCAREGIAYAEESTALSNTVLRGMRAIRYSYKLRRVNSLAGVEAGLGRIARMTARGPLSAPEPVGMYIVATRGGRQLWVAIDANDSGEILAPAAAAADVYFKSNFWPTLHYPEHVLPLANLNPLVGREIRFLRSLRGTAKSIDLFAYFRLWGGRNEVDGVEHNLALIEALARVRCSKFLRAYLVAGDIDSIGKRLTSQGIEWTTKPMTPRELWRLAASARLNVVRLGMHECSPWRMIDVLAMGGCPVIDYGPQTLWPQPMVEGEHYLSLNVPPGKSSMDAVPERVAGWLGQGGLMAEIAGNTAKYFDGNLAPIQLGESILKAIASRF